MSAAARTKQGSANPGSRMMTTWARSTGGVDMAGTTSTKIGFVGLGHMGANMAARFLAAGYEVFGERRTREHVQYLVDEGLRWCDTPREVTEAADIVFTSIPDDSVLEDVGSAPEGILEGLGPETVWVDLSTVSPRASRQMAGRVRRAWGDHARRAGVRERAPGAVRHAHHHGRRGRKGLRTC
jgi:3-hydroxyisobutyrate dehydrogenase-like beta-hydroxyacid dehydrogenase